MVWTFSPQWKDPHKGDRHKVFNLSNFFQWQKEQLLPNLHQPSLMTMDNAKHHCLHPECVPRGQTKKANWQPNLQLHDTPHDTRETVPVPMLKAKAKAQMKSHEKFVVQLLDEANGHEALFVPPCHGNLQPIELLWAKLKRQHWWPAQQQQHHNDNPEGLLGCRICCCNDLAPLCGRVHQSVQCQGQGIPRCQCEQEE